MLIPAFEPERQRMLESPPFAGASGSDGRSTKDGSRPMTPTIRKRLGRSLVELLVVLGIIALLVSFLVPAALMAYRAAVNLKP